MTDLEIAILAFEKKYWRYAGAKEAAIKAEFGMTPTTYYAKLAKLIWTQDALAADPVLVKRLQRIATARSAS